MHGSDPCRTPVRVVELDNQWNRFSLRGKFSRRSLTSLLRGGSTDARSFLRFFGDLVNPVRKRRLGNWEPGQAIQVLIRDPRQVSALPVCGVGQELNSGGIAASKDDDRETAGTDVLDRVRAAANDSPLWTEDGRSYLRQNFLGDSVLNATRNASGAHLLAGLLANINSRVDSMPGRSATESSRTIPIVIIPVTSPRTRSEADGAPKQSFTTGTTPCDGFDILVPPAYGSVVWRELVTRGKASAIGVEEYDRIQLNSGSLCFPRDYPDTVAGNEFWKKEKRVRENRRELMMRLGKLAKDTFENSTRTMDWTELYQQIGAEQNFDVEAVDEDNVAIGHEAHYEQFQDLTVIRSLRYFEPFQPLQTLSGESYDSTNLGKASLPEEFEHVVGLSIRAHPRLVCTKMSIPCGPTDPMFVPTGIHPLSRGIPKTFAELYVANEEDVQQVLRHRLMRKVTRNRVLSGVNGACNKRMGDWKGILLSSEWTLNFPFTPVIYVCYVCRSICPTEQELDWLCYIWAKSLFGCARHGYWALPSARHVPSLQDIMGSHSC
jgi:hypothetical protein